MGWFDPDEEIELAKAYVALSNAHAVELIRSMFDRAAVYRSTSVGEFSGPAAITQMMSEFFARFPDVHWSVGEYRYTGPATVEFDFVMTATERGGGDPIERRGVERIRFTDTGLIARLEVEAG